MDLPDGWTAVVAEGPGPFVTRARLRRADGSMVAWHSRAHRKRPGRLAVWMSALFAAGSLCFAVGATASQFGSSSLETAIGVTFFVGSLAARLDNAGTALGAVCFFVGAVLLVPEARRSQRATA